jgi:hypothetical protein
MISSGSMPDLMGAGLRDVDEQDHVPDAWSNDRVEAVARGDGAEGLTQSIETVRLKDGMRCRRMRVTSNVREQSHASVGAVA